MSGTLIILTPSGVLSEQRWEGTGKKSSPPLEMLQNAVDGYIEHVKVRFNGRVRDAYVNEEGLINGLPFNMAATVMTQNTIYEGCILHGNLAVWVPDPKASKKWKPEIDPLDQGDNLGESPDY